MLGTPYTIFMIKILVGSLVMLISIIILALIFTFDSETNTSVPLLRRVSVNGTYVRVHVADTEEARSRGLSGTQNLAPDEGMLFVFDKPGIYSFWMKDMLIPIDIIWIDENGVIVKIAHEVQPESYPNAFTPENEALYVLEVVSGFSEIYNIEVGQKVDL
jgi:uncharacterized membrane protein (UPF0127 family)